MSPEREAAELRDWFRRRAEETEHRLDVLEADLARRLAPGGPVVRWSGRRVNERAVRAAAAATLALALTAFAVGFLLARFW